MAMTNTSDEERAADAKKPTAAAAETPPPPPSHRAPPLEPAAHHQAREDPPLESSDDGADDDCDGVPFDEADHADGRARYEGGGGGDRDGGTVATAAAAAAPDNPKAGRKPPNPYIGKLVIAVRGRHQGSRGIVREAGRGGWWTIDVVVSNDEERADAPGGPTPTPTTSADAASSEQHAAAATADQEQRDAQIKDALTPGVPASGGSDAPTRNDAVPSAGTAGADANADGTQAPPTTPFPPAVDAAVPSYRPTGVAIRVQNGQCRMLDPITVKEIDAYNEETGAWLSLVRPYRRTPTADGRTSPTADGGADGGDAGSGTDIMDGGGDDDEEDDNDGDEEGADGDDTGGSNHRRGGGGRASRKRGRRGSASANGSGSGSSYYLQDDRLSSVDRDVLWKRLQPPDGCPPSWRDWRESLPPHVLERLAEASVPPPALRVAGNKMPRRAVVASTYDVIANDTADGAANEETMEDNKVHPVDSTAAGNKEALPMPRPSPSDIATKLVVDPMASKSLPPVVLPSSPVDNDTAIGLSVPKAARHLPLESKVDIFDRKTGRVLSGRSAVSVRDLASVLRTHASYEPIVPPPAIEEVAAEAVAEAARRAAVIRQGRTAPNITVSANIEPQVRVRASAMEGREVIVTDGRLKGLVGKIEACLPGGWYVVSDLLDERELGVEHVVSSASLDLLESSNKSLGSAATVPLDCDGKLPSAKDLVESFQSTFEKLYSNPLRQMNLRLEEMEKEKESIASYLGLDENGQVHDIEKTKAATGLHGLRIHQLQQRWEKLNKDFEGIKTKRAEYESAGGGIAAIMGKESQATFRA